MKEKIALLSTLLAFTVIGNTTLSEGRIKNNEENIITRNVEYKETVKKENSFYDINSNLDKNNKYIVTCKKDFSYDMLSNIDNVSLSKVENYIGETINYKIVFDISNMKYYLTVSLESYNEDSFTLEGTIIQTEKSINIIFEDTDGNKYYLSNLTDKNSIDSVGLFRLIKNLVSKSIARLTYDAISLVLPSSVADMIWNVAINILGGERNILENISTISSAITNYNHNRNKGEPSDYITRQEDIRYADYRLGHWQKLSEKGCGIVAMYNVLRQMGKTTNIRDIILKLDIMNGYTAESRGLAGVAPECISSVMALSGVKTTKYAYWQTSSYNNDYNNNNSIILVRNGSFYYHYYAVYKTSSGKYKTRNNSSDHNEYTNPSDTITGTMMNAYVFR